jgi:hypothetical protein
VSDDRGKPRRLGPEQPMPEPTAADRAHARKRLWWVRLILPVWVERVWLFAATVILVVALFRLDAQQERIAGLVADVQHERAVATRSSCEDQNHRHDQTVARLRALVKRIKDPRRHARAERNIGGTILLIDALAPKQDCEALVRERVGSPSRP